MATKISRCGHVVGIGRITWEEIKQAQKHEVCDTCNVKATNLWLCLIGRCTYIGCGESVKDHSSHHAESKGHCLTINLSTLRIWCYRCESEVYHDRNIPPFLIPDKQCEEEGMDIQDELTTDNSPQHSAFGDNDTESDAEEDSSGHQIKPKGLTGLQNLGNTCYLNAALQALSNCPPLTRYFLDCQGFVHPDKNPMLSKNYKKLMSEMWHRNRPSYLVPSSIVSGIKLVHPMFRGYAQQDTQEFLRCFMDQLHEELKQVIADDMDDKEAEPDIHEATSSPVIGHRNPDPGHVAMDTSSTSSQSDCDYETCDSAIGSEKEFIEQNGGSSDEGADINEYSRLNLSSNNHDLRSHVRRGRSRMSEKGENMDTGNKLGNSSSKDKKDTANKSMKNAESTNVCTDDQRSDNGDYVDAESDLTRTRRQARRTTSMSSDRDNQPHNRQQRQKASGNFPTSTGAGKNVQYRSVISDIFDGKLNSSVQCLTCERVSTTKETFQDLSLPIPSKDHVHMLHASSHGPSGPKGGTCSEVQQGWIHYVFGWMRSWFLGPIITLQDCLAAFFSADELKGDNMYSCEKCKKLRNGLKYSKVLELPEVLCIHLKRFRHEFYSSKINTYVSFPLTNLDMKPYLHKDHSSTVTMYDLIAVICHHGTAGGGHYTAYCQNVFTEQWYEYDDQYVTEVDVSQVINCEAYVLFYRKQNDHMNSLRQDAVEMMNRHEPSLMQFFISKQWINRFNTFAEPGPITNEDFLCRHGGVPPNITEFVGDLVQPLTQDMWEFLHDRFGGGPACNHLFACTQCHKELELLRNRQQNELEEFVKLNEKFKEEDNPCVIYAISMSWFKEWEDFVREKEDNAPGPIDNKRISVMKNGQLSVCSNSHHGQLSGEMWRFLYDIYGGGPELVLKQITHQPTLAAQAKSFSEQSQMAGSSSSQGSKMNKNDSTSGVHNQSSHNTTESDAGSRTQAPERASCSSEPSTDHIDRDAASDEMK